jgi:excisionase family DNA binding protein
MSTPSFENLPGLVLGLQQQVGQLQTTIDKLVQAKEQPQSEERIYGDKGLAEYLKCTVQTISRLKMAGKIPFHRYGRRYYYLRSEVDQAFNCKRR